MRRVTGKAKPATDRMAMMPSTGWDSKMIKIEGGWVENRMDFHPGKEFERISHTSTHDYPSDLQFSTEL